MACKIYYICEHCGWSTLDEEEIEDGCPHCWGLAYRVEDGDE